MRALIVVDIQNDFLPGGALAVNEGHLIIPVVNGLMSKFELVVATQDWHPANHQSFASNHSEKEVGEVVDLYGLPQILWPDHCVQHSRGAEFSDDLNTSAFSQVFQKGTDPRVDSYSGFFDNGRKNDTGMADYLKTKKVSHVYVVGLATDYCVKYTALDAVSVGFKTSVVSDATRAVNLQPEDYNTALQDMSKAGVLIVESKDISPLSID